jgi:hypothetical protein
VPEIAPLAKQTKRRAGPRTHADAPPAPSAAAPIAAMRVFPADAVEEGVGVTAGSRMATQEQAGAGRVLPALSAADREAVLEWLRREGGRYGAAPRRGRGAHGELTLTFTDADGDTLVLLREREGRWRRQDEDNDGAREALLSGEER